MLITESGGAQSAAHPALQTSHCEKTRAAEHTGPNLQTFKCSSIYQSTQRKSKLAGKHIPGMQGCFICVFYRSWVPDEDLGAAVRELVCQDLEVGHQHLHSFPMGSQKGHMGHPKHT